MCHHLSRAIDREGVGCVRVHNRWEEILIKYFLSFPDKNKNILDDLLLEF